MLSCTHPFSMYKPGTTSEKSQYLYEEVTERRLGGHWGSEFPSEFHTYLLWFLSVPRGVLRITSLAFVIPSWKALSAEALCLRIRSSSASFSIRSVRKITVSSSRFYQMNASVWQLFMLLLYLCSVGPAPPFLSWPAWSSVSGSSLSWSNPLAPP